MIYTSCYEAWDLAHIIAMLTFFVNHDKIPPSCYYVPGIKARRNAGKIESGNSANFPLLVSHEFGGSRNADFIAADKTRREAVKKRNNDAAA